MVANTKELAGTEQEKKGKTCLCVGKKDGMGIKHGICCPVWSSFSNVKMMEN